MRQKIALALLLLAAPGLLKAQERRKVTGAHSETCIPIGKDRCLRTDTVRVRDTIRYIRVDTVSRLIEERQAAAAPVTVNVRERGCWDTWVCPVLAGAVIVGGAVAGYECLIHHYCMEQKTTVIDNGMRAGMNRSSRPRALIIPFRFSIP